MFLLLLSPATAQTLDFSRTPPIPNDKYIHHEQAAQLNERGADLLAAGGPRDAVRAQLRRIAAGLLRQDDGSHGADGGHIVLAWTIRRHLPELDSAIADAPMDDAAMQRIADDLRALVVGSVFGTEPFERRFRDALAPITALLSPSMLASGWPDQPSTPAPPDEIELRARIDRPPVLGADDAIALVAAGRAHPAYTHSADRVARRLVAASRSLDLPAWVDPTTRARLGERFADAVDLLVHAEASTASEQLDRIALAADVALLLDDEPDSRSTRLARTTLVDRLNATGPIETRPLSLGKRALRLIHGEQPAKPPPELVKLLRPSWAAISADDAARREALRALLPSILAQPDASTDPGVVSAIAACTRTTREFDDLLSLNLFVRGPTAKNTGRAVVYRPFRAIATRAARLEREHPPDARRLARRAARHAVLTGEVDLREALDQSSPQQWCAAIAPVAGDLLGAIDQTREDWIAAKTKQSADAASTRLDQLARLMALIDLVRAHETRSRWSVQDWGGWELSDDATAALFDGLDEAALELTRSLLSGTEPETISTQLDLAEEVSQSARLLVVLDTRWRSLPGADEPIGIGECVLGPPDERWGWLAGVRDDIALVCRYADASAISNDPERYGRPLELRGYADHVAGRVLIKIRINE